MNKSILNGMKTKEEGFFVKKGFPAEPMQGKLVVVGACKKCGKPIYGKLEIDVGENPVAKYSCFCHPTG